MNKQELIEKYKRLEGVWDAPGAETARQIFLQDLEQLDEPQKVVVPQFVADYIDISKFYVCTLHYALESSPEKVNLWLCENEINRQNTFARAWLDGYEVEKEKQYLVKFKAAKHYFAKDGNGRIYFSLKYESAFTKIELEKANLDWVFDCPGIEIEEVE